MMNTGLLGRKLGHSYSPRIHAHLGSYRYDLFEREPEDLADFLQNGSFSAINVTIPYKTDVIPYCAQLSDAARQLGAVNTVVRRPDGSLTGHNTDYFGFLSMVQHYGFQPAGKKVLILGSGGASRPARAVMEHLGARVTVLSHRENTPENLLQHRDTAILVNATPVGMYPNPGVSPVDLDAFPALEGVLDMIYNPCRTKLIMDAQARGIHVASGLWMLIAQAKEAAEWFTGNAIADSVIAPIYSELRSHMENIVLIGMPGCGKSTVGRLLAQATDHRFVDADAEIEAEAGMTIPEIFARGGEAAFRTVETRVLARLGMASNLVIATGGGCVTREENYPLLHQNGTVIWLQRALDTLATDGRPLSQAGRLEEMYRIRRPLYTRFADHSVANNAAPEDCAAAIRNLLF